MFRLYSLVLAFYLAFAAPTAYAIGAAADAAATAAAARAAAALGAGEGLGVALGGAAAAAAAVGAFALAFCATSYIMGTDLCSPSNPETGGGIAAAINQPSSGLNGKFIWKGTNEIYSYATASEACDYPRITSNPAISFSRVEINGTSALCYYNYNGEEYQWSIARQVSNPHYNPNAEPDKNTPDVAGDNISGNPRAAAGVGGAAAAKARGASDSAAESAARAAAAATGTGNPSRDRAAGNTGAAAGAAAAAAEAAGGSKADVDKAAKDAANTAAAAADKAAPEEKTCQSNGASVDGRYCTDATAQPKPNSLPVFCTWAAVVCEMAVKSISTMDAINEFFTGVKADPTAATSEKVEIKERQVPFTPASFEQNYFSFNATCPAAASGSFELLGSTVPLSFDYTPICNFATGARPFILAGAMIAAAFIVAGANRES